MDNYIDISDLSYYYGDTIALNSINLKIKRNELFGVIGPDGAGKTTLFRILATLLIPKQGNVLLNEINVTDKYKFIRNIIGYMPGKFSLYMDLSVEENLNFFASVFNTTVEENYHLIETIYKQLEPFKKRKAGKLSGGMKQKLALSCALIHKPELLILDEPTTGVDAVSRKEFWEMLTELKTKGITIIVSTPYMDEASLCDRVALIHNGSILQIDNPANITRSYNRKLFSIKAGNIYKTLNILRNYKNIETAYPFGQDIHITLKNDDLIGLNTYLENENFRNFVIEKCVPGIEDSFMALMGVK